MPSHSVQTLLSGTLDAGIAMSLDGRICYCNVAAEHLFGISGQGLLGRSCIHMLEGCGEHGEKVCHSTCTPLARAAKGRPTEAFDFEIHGAQCRRWVNASTLVLNAPNEDPLVIHLLRDIDRRKRLELLVRQLLLQLPTLKADAMESAVFSPPPHANLSAKEKEVLELLCKGHSSKEVAEQLTISPATARNHVQHILHKLSVHSRTEAALQALHDHLI